MTAGAGDVLGTLRLGEEITVRGWVWRVIGLHDGAVRYLHLAPMRPVNGMVCRCTTPGCPMPHPT